MRLSDLWKISVGVAFALGGCSGPRKQPHQPTVVARERARDCSPETPCDPGPPLPPIPQCHKASGPLPRALPCSQSSTTTDAGRANGSVTWSPYKLDWLCGGCPNPDERRDSTGLVTSSKPREIPFSQPGLAVVTSEQQYLDVLCMRSTIDWCRFRLVVLTEYDPPSEVVVESVVREGSLLKLMLRRTCNNTNTTAMRRTLAVLVPAGNEAIVPIRFGEPVGTCP
jgi:hypothetical protein